MDKQIEKVLGTVHDFKALASFETNVRVRKMMTDEVEEAFKASLGQMVQDKPPRQSVEFSYLVIPALLFPPKPSIVWPGVMMVTAPTPMKPYHEEAGMLFQSPGLARSLHDRPRPPQSRSGERCRSSRIRA